MSCALIQLELCDQYPCPLSRPASTEWRDLVAGAFPSTPSICFNVCQNLWTVSLAMVFCVHEMVGAAFEVPRCSFRKETAARYFYEYRRADARLAIYHCERLGMLCVLQK